MKVELEEPFKSKWKKGYLVTNSENRRNIILYNNPRDRTTIAYARYLFSVKIGELVPPNLEVDHKDNDKTNDSIDNLQLLTRKENVTKENSRRIEVTKQKHGSLSCYTYCHCDKCRLGKRLYYKKDFDAYYALFKT